MQLKLMVPVILLLCLLTAGCSKKHLPSSEVTTDKPEEKKVVAKKVARVPLPKIITVDDRAAKKSVDGRLYYDLEGHRYWRNYNDGKYYLYNKSMYSNLAFTPH